MTPLRLIEHPLWQFVVLIACTISAILISNHLVLSVESIRLDFVLDWCVTVVFIIDAYIRYANIRERKSTSVQKIQRFTLSFDIIAAIPWTVILGSPIWDLPRLIKLIRVPEFFQERPKLPTPINIAIQLCSFIYWAFLGAHWLACGWMSLASETNYLVAIYWSVTTLTTVGYGDITPDVSKVPQTIYTMVVMFLGVGFYGYIIGNITTLLQRLDMKKSMYYSKINQVSNFLNYRKVPSTIQHRILDYYTFLWENRIGFNETQLLRDLPQSLEDALSLSLKGNLIAKVPFFHEAEEDLIQDIARRLKPMVFTPGDLIFKQGENGNTMYFIGKGFIEIIQNEKHIVTISDGNFIGEIALLHDQPRTASAKSTGYSDLYELSKSDLDHILKLHPKFANHIQQIAYERSKNSVKQ